MKPKGKARMTSMLKSGKALEIFSVKESDLKNFVQGAKQYGKLMHGGTIVDATIIEAPTSYMLALIYQLVYVIAEMLLKGLAAILFKQAQLNVKIRHTHPCYSGGHISGVFFD